MDKDLKRKIKEGDIKSLLIFLESERSTAAQQLLKRKTIEDLVFYQGAHDTLDKILSIFKN